MKIVEKIEKSFKPERMLKIDKEELKKELYYLECNPHVGEYLLDVQKKAEAPVENTNNSTIFYLMGISDDLPKEGGIQRTATVLPDVDYDTDARDEVKKFLQEKYGINHVTLLGTYMTLKTKGAIKDVIRQLLPQMNFEEVNNLTKKFDAVKRLDFDNIGFILEQSGKDYSFAMPKESELAYFYACLENDPSLMRWFNEHEKVRESVTQILGVAKSSGIHAGGIVVTRADITRTIPLTWSEKEHIYVTQPEMAYVEASGLIKYDFLGLSTLKDINICLKLIKERHGKIIKLSDIPHDDARCFESFQKGNTTSIFQFNTYLAVSILTKLKSVNNVNDLAITTSIARPGPLNMKMDKAFIKRKNGEEPIKYFHPLLEPILKDTYGIYCYQEQIMKTVQELGDLTGDESVVVLKGLGKKDLEKIAKYKDKFVANAKNKGIPDDTCEQIWEHMLSFAAYGFNKSHAIAYSLVSYYSMWLKEYYPSEWMAACLTNSDKDKFKIFYQQWKDNIVRPDINKSKAVFLIGEDLKIAMPLSSINGVGDAAVASIVEKQPYSSFKDFFERVDKRKVNKASMINLILSGTFDSLKPSKHFSELKFRISLINELYQLRKEKDTDDNKKFLKEINEMTRPQMTMKEISLLNFTSFNYYEFYHNQMTEGAKKLFGSEAVKPEDIKTMKNNAVVVVGGAVESIKLFPVKTGKSKGKMMARIKLSNESESCDVTIFPSTMEMAADVIAKIKEYTPIIIKGKINHYNGNVSLVYEQGWPLA